MRVIPKGSEPESLRQFRGAGYSGLNRFDDYPDKRELSRRLAEEQRGLCCYCLSRIPDAGGIKIEHWHSQSEYPAEQLNYRNLLGACRGNEGHRVSDQHCDTRKANRRLSRNPAEPLHNVEALIYYLPDGRIGSTDAEFDTELNEILNLNHNFLRANRKAALDGFLQSLGTRPLNAPTIEGHIRRWNGDDTDGPLEPHCQVIIYWLKKRLRLETRS